MQSYEKNLHIRYNSIRFSDLTSDFLPKALRFSSTFLIFANKQTKPTFMKRLHSLLAMLAILVATGMFFTSCEDDDENQMIYIYGFSDVQFSASSDSESMPNEVLEEMQIIEDAFKKQFKGAESPLLMFGPAEECDKQMLNSCKLAEEELNGQIWQYGTYTYSVTNTTTNQTVYKHTFAKAE